MGSSGFNESSARSFLPLQPPCRERRTRSGEIYLFIYFRTTSCPPKPVPSNSVELASEEKVAGQRLGSRRGSPGVSG